MADDPTAPSTAASRLTGVLDRALGLRSPRVRRVTYAVAAVLFAATAAAGLAGLPARTADTRPALFVVVAVVLGPAISVCNAAEYAVTARFAGVRVRAVDAGRVAVLSTAANLLPVPGAVLVRAGALRREGTGYGRAARVTVAAGAAWLATTAVLAGLVLVVAGDRPLVGGVFLVAGVAAVAGAHRIAGGHRRADGAGLTAALVAVEAATVAVGALRLWLCIRGLGQDADAVQATLLTFASVLASAAGVFPGGLGLREALAAAIGPLVALPAAVGAAGSAVDRLLGLPVVLLAAGAFAVAGTPRQRPRP